jgi:hypothetical protein
MSAKARSISIVMRGPLYVGLGVCSHNVDALQNVTFTDVQLNSKN